MAGSWIKVDTTITTRPQVVRIASALERTVSDTIGACVVFWCAATEQGIDGDLPKWDDSVVDALVGIKGFAKALRSVGWLTDLPGDQPGLQVPRWQEHNAASAKRLAQDRERKRKGRMLSASRPLSVRKESASCLPDRGQPSTSTSTSSSSVFEEGSVRGDDPWAIPVRQLVRMAKGAPNPEANVALREFGLSVSSAAKWAAHENATTDRVRWLTQTAKERMTAGTMDRDFAVRFVCAGIRDGLDPDTGPAPDKSALAGMNVGSALDRLKAKGRL